MSDLPGSEAIETREDVETDPQGTVGFYLQQLKLAEEKEFEKRGRAIVKRYRDERSENAKGTKFNILWSNVETLKPILYGRTPKPDVERRHKDSDKIARLGAMILERALAYEDDLDEFDAVMDRVVEDRLLPGRGVARVYYEPKYGKEEEDINAEPGEDGKRPMIKPKTGERARIGYVFWEDYRESPARTCYEVWWKAYRTYETRDDLIKRFGEEKGKAVTLDYSPPSMGKTEDGPPDDAFSKAEVWEIWDKPKKRVVWVATSYADDLLDSKDDPLGLPEFFPSPDPLSASTTNDTTRPVADYYEYQDQALELDLLTTRIDRLTSALKVAGVYPGVQKNELQQLMTSGENQLIAVEDWMAFADKGGLQNMIQWFPVEQIAKVLIQLYDARDRVLRTLYQITGMADILRGETNPNETLGAQQLKSQFATRRISRAQKQVARFARDLMRLRGFVIAKHFSPETLSLMCGFPEPMEELPPPPPQYVPASPQPGPSPMMGHNGGPPMDAPGMGAAPISPVHPVAAAAPPGAPHPMMPGMAA